MYALKTNSQKGFTLVELMISLVISLFVGLAAVSSAKFFMSMQRQMVSAGASVANATTGLSVVKYELGQAGLGFFDKGKVLCPSFNVSNDTNTVLSNAVIQPVRISMVNGKPSLSVFYGTALESAGATYLATDTTNSAETAKISTYLSVQPGQAVLLAPKENEATPCSVKTVTSVTASTGSGQTLNFANTGKHNKVAFNAANYSSGSAVALLGQLINTTISVDGSNNLVMARPIDGTSAVLARNVVAVSMQYGVSDLGRTTVADWFFPIAYPNLASGAEDWSTLTASQLSRVKAVKLSVLVQSEQKDKKVDGNCVSTLDMPTLQGYALGQALPSAIGVGSNQVLAPALTGDWACYRYQETSIVVPLRNLQLGLNT